MNFKIKKRSLLVNEYFKVEKAIVEFDQHFDEEPVETIRFNLIRGFAVTTLLYHKEKNALILVKQFRYSTAEAGYPWMIELPAGLTETDENPLIAAKRETLEETGYLTNNLIEINRFFVAPGCTDEQIILYYAEVDENSRISSGGGVNGENEDIKLIFLPVDLIDDFMENEVIDAKTIIGLNWFKNNKL